jgi:hypothetical protein
MTSLAISLPEPRLSNDRDVRLAHLLPMPAQPGVDGRHSLLR